jgi:hypothetical protein
LRSPASRGGRDDSARYYRKYFSGQSVPLWWHLLLNRPDVLPSPRKSHKPRLCDTLWLRIMPARYPVTPYKGAVTTDSQKAKYNKHDGEKTMKATKLITLQWRSCMRIAFPRLLEVRPAVSARPRFCPHVVGWEMDQQSCGNPTLAIRINVVQSGSNRSVLN